MKNYTPTFESEISGLTPGTREYIAVVEKWNGIRSRERTAGQEREYCHKAAKKIIYLCAPVKPLSVSRLMNLKRSQLDSIGKAARELYDELDRAGLIPRDRVSYRSGD